MRSFVFAIAPMIVLFTIPVAIPLFTVGFGALADRIRPPRPSPVEQAVAAAQARSAPWRAEMKRRIEEAAAAPQPSVEPTASDESRAQDDRKDLSGPPDILAA